MSEQPTCGKGLADHAPLPELLGRLTLAVADVLEAHLKALDPTDAAARVEHEAYSRLIADHRQAGAALGRMGERMAAYRDLPMGRHHPEVLAGPGVRDAFERFVRLEEELVALLQRRLERDRRMLAETGAGD